MFCGIQFRRCFWSAIVQGDRCPITIIWACLTFLPEGHGTLYRDTTHRTGAPHTCRSGRPQESQPLEGTARSPATAVTWEPAEHTAAVCPTQDLDVPPGVVCRDRKCQPLGRAEVRLRRVCRLLADTPAGTWRSVPPSCLQGPDTRRKTFRARN